MNENKYYKGFNLFGRKDRLFTSVNRKNTSPNGYSWNENINYPSDQKVFEAEGELDIGKNGIHFSKSFSIILSNLQLQKSTIVIYECIPEEFIYDDNMDKGCCKKLTLDKQVFGIDFTEYSYVRPLENGLFRVKKDLWGAIDLSGNVIIPFEYTFIGDFDPKSKSRQLGFQSNQGLIESIFKTQ